MVAKKRFSLDRYGRNHFTGDGGLCGPPDCLYVWLLEGISAQQGPSSPGVVVPKVVCCSFCSRVFLCLTKSH